MRALALALLVAMPPGVHYQGTQGTGSVAWTPPGFTLPTISDTFGATSGSNPSITGVTITGGANVLAVAFVHTGGNQDYRTKTSFTSTGGLTWTLRASAAATGGTLGDEISEIFTAPVASTITSQTITVTTSGGGAWVQDLLIIAVSGADVTNIGSSSNGGTASGTGSANGAGSGNSGAATVSLTPTQANSLLVATGGEWNGSAARTYAADQTAIRESRDTGNVGDHWTQRLTNGSTTSSTALATTNSISGSSAYSMAALEIKGI